MPQGPAKTSIGLDLAAKVGPFFGGVMGLFYSTGYGLQFYKRHDLDDLAQVAFGLGFGVSAWAIGRAIKKSTDINVSAQAENRINDPNRSNESVVPQIQREIDKQLGNTPEKE